jgi:hypothetical protein
VNSAPARQIHKRAHSQELADLLQTIFVAELLAPGPALWIVSPWISDIPVIDNRGDEFVLLDPSWSRTRVTLSRVLLKLAAIGTTVVIATRPDPRNRYFVETMRAGGAGLPIPPIIHQSAELHSKGILGDGYWLGGSMNLTHYGISVNEEWVGYHTDMDFVTKARMALADRWRDAS